MPGKLKINKMSSKGRNMVKRKVKKLDFKIDRKVRSVKSIVDSKSRKVKRRMKK